MSNDENSFRELEKLLADKNTTPKQLSDLAWLLEHPEYQERPVDIRTFIDSSEHLNAKGECWPSIKDDLEGLFSGLYDEAVFCEGIGAGKSFKSSVIITFMVYRSLCLKNPQEYYGLAKGSPIVFINMSVRAEQSRKVVFGEIKSRIDNSPWFQKNYPPDPNIKSELRFAKSITVFPGNSKETFPLGFNILGGVMDEAAWYTETETHDVAEDMFNALHNRIKNRFGDKGLLVMISSPRYAEDFIESKMKEASTNKKIFARRKTLWEAKSPSSFSGEWIAFQEYKIPKEFETESKRNPEAFKRDYMAIPSLALEPFFKQMDLVEQAIDPKIMFPFDELERFKPEFKGPPEYRGKLKRWHYIHVDLALKRDAVGFAMAHDEGEVVVVDLMMRIKAPQNGEIDFSAIRERILNLRRLGFRIDRVTYDGWQSIDSLQILKKEGFKCEVLSVDRNTIAYDTLKEKIYGGKLKCYRYEPFLQEMRRLELKDGVKVDHPPHIGSKDVTDAVAGAVFMTVQRSAKPREVTAEII